MDRRTLLRFALGGTVVGALRGRPARARGDAMQSQTFTLQAGGAIQPAVAFMAQSARVNNPGGQWVRFASTGAYVEPYTLNAVIALDGAQTVAIDTTPPATQVNTGTGSPATIVLSEQPLAPSAGISVLGTVAGNAAIVIVSSTGATLGGSSNLALSGDISARFTAGTEYQIDGADFLLAGVSGGAFGLNLQLWNTLPPTPPTKTTNIIPWGGGNSSFAPFLPYRPAVPLTFTPSAPLYLVATLNPNGGSGTGLCAATLFARQLTR
jgi:hypothetical protein